MKPAKYRWFAASAFALAGSVATAADHIVEVGRDGLTFTPGLLTIRRGDTVTFVNIIGNHNVVASSGAFRCANGCDGAGGNGNLSVDLWRATVQFDRVGTFGYYCQAHGDPDGGGMYGSITVVDDAPAFAITPAITGNWYDPAQNGHGFQLEMISPTLVTAFWFTFDNAGNPAWLVGSGTVDGDRIVMAVNRSTGGRFPPNFDAAAIVNRPWGTWTLTFGGCDAGRVEWVTSDPSFTTPGVLSLKRLTQIQGVGCL
ncbi:plastocyanin/azurin family copper-binding protein [Tahibacter soli]|uniref:Plastocyanin/azurin family copper-binding protein n=1 Tax=Tahibacter soli TaxID=2983605 RepID=A0A9X3YI49_9GAMM|nr:plastocyanin/azurin family copper-binding protein [Tahibacter soli]MDC8012077.1 plastocyanin/azurin family copper-binding protein [Tahibacter soli]